MSNVRPLAVTAIMYAAVVVLGPATSAGNGAPPEALRQGEIAPAVVRTPVEVQALIDEVGSTIPEWLDSVELDYPETLDLTWQRAKKGEGWQPRKYMGPYLISIVHRSPKRWKPTVKLLYKMLEINQGDRRKTRRTYEALADIYGSLLQDYARAAYCYRKAGANQPLALPGCYWRLGSKEMAVKLLRRMPTDTTRNCALARLWAKMGDVEKAIGLAEAKGRQGQRDVAYLAAGDICRAAGDFERAISYYERVLDTRLGSRGLKNNQRRARANLEATHIFASLDIGRIPDGTYSGSAPGFRRKEGNLEVEVVVKDGRIESVRQTKTYEDMPRRVFMDIPPLIVKNQGIKGVDAITSATVTSDTFIRAAADALARAPGSESATTE